MFGKKSSPKGAESKAAAPAAKSEAKPAAAPAAKPKEKKGLTLPFIGKKKVSAPPPASKPEGKPAAAAAAAPPKPAAKPPAKKGSPLKLLLPVVLILALAGGAYFVLPKFLGGGGGGETPAAAAPVAQVSLTDPQNTLTDDGPASSAKPAAKKKVVSCNGTPKFYGKLKLPKSAAFSTNEPNTRGLVLLSPIENSDAVSKYQNQSWNRSGFMDAFVVDQNGNVYAGPSPRTGLGVAKPSKQDHVFKVDTNSGELKDMLTLPSAAPTSPENPYGVLGLALDCDTNSLYVTTVTGSTDANQVGRIFRVDYSSGDITGQLENIDGYGVAVRSTANGKQLVYGSARDGKIRAVNLDAAGNFQGEPQEIAALDDTKRARTISFSGENGMLVQAVDFVFTKSDIPQGDTVSFQFDAGGNKWNLVQ